MIGVIKSYNTTKGYGFITADGKDYRFRGKTITLRIPPTPGLRVVFDPYETSKGLRAANIRKEK